MIYNEDNSEKKRAVTYHIPSYILALLDDYCRSENKIKSGVVSTAIKEYLDRVMKENKK